ncbi:MAG: SH3 domain-containing protein [Chloroflexota bacterium]|nr:SH3 domain-containing protein [Chloroflexota bacterium]
MSNGIKFVFLLSVILIVMFSMTFAQDVPFNAEVIVETARMRWGPGPAYTVQHYANLGHVLTILEADTESNPPWTWYRARTPSGVESWIRGDLVRRATGAAARVDMPTGTFPVLENNLCNDDILFRRCQDGTDHDLWEAGYWANDRYNHWETGGWDLNIVYHNNPCKLDRLCTTREDWDAGAQEAALIVASLTPEATWTPVVVRLTSEVEVPTTWQTLVVTGSSVTIAGNTVPLYAPPREMRSGTDGSIIGGFRFNSESVRVTCQYWHNADLAPDADPVESGKFNVSSFRAAEDADKVNCVSGNIQEGNVTQRQWEITLTRSYSGSGRITGVSWTATATVRATDGTVTMTEALQAYLENVRTDVTKRDFDNSDNPYGVETLPVDLSNSSCSGRRTPPADEDEQNVIRYEYTCNARDDDDVGTTLKFNFTHDRTRGFLRETATPRPIATS